MRHILIFLLLFSCAFSIYGYSRITIERTWIVEDAEGAHINFTGNLIVNNSNQRVVSLTIDPKASHSTNEDGVISVHYNGTINDNHFSIKGIAIVDVDYNTNIYSDSNVPLSTLSSTNLTMPNNEIRTEAQLLANHNSSLKTVKDLVNWVHNYVEYDLNYWGRSNSAQDVFNEKRGVCVEYSHLLISMARSVGFDTRYVSGYVLTTSWQPHAWVEIYIPNYDWLPVDATFDQVGILDSGHVAISYGDDQSTSYDLLLANRQNITMEVQNSLTEQFSIEDPKGASLSIDFDNQSNIVTVSIMNERSEYLFGNYMTQLPDEYGGVQSTVLLLNPNENIYRYYGLNLSLFNSHYVYTIPVYSSFNDAKDDELIKITGTAPNGASASPELCPAAFLLLGFLCIRAVH